MWKYTECPDVHLRVLANDAVRYSTWPTGVTRRSRQIFLIRSHRPRTDGRLQILAYCCHIDASLHSLP